MSQQYANSIGPLTRSARGQWIVTGIAVNLKRTTEALKDLFGVFPLAGLLEVKCDAWTGVPVPAAVIAVRRPNEAGLGLACSMHELRKCGFVHQYLNWTSDHRLERRKAGATHRQPDP